MPIYEYRCDDCGRTSEALQRVDDPPLTECEHCGGRLRKLLSAPAFQFKGSGWYVTDYADKPKGGAGSGDAGGKGSGGESSAAGGSGGEKEKAKPTAAKSSDGD